MFPNSGEINVSYDYLIDDAIKVSNNFMGAGIDYIDKCFGEGYAEEHPELLAAYMTSASNDFTASSTSKSNQYITESITNMIRDELSEFRFIME